MTKMSQVQNDVGGFFTVAAVNEALSASDNLTFTITRYVGDEKVGQDGTTKPVIYFAETKKGLILSKGRAQQLGDLFGQEDIEGKKIKLNVATIRSIAQIVCEGV